MDPSVMAHLTVYNIPAAPAMWDRFGRFEIGFACTWTTIVLAGMVFCWCNRKSPVMKVRGMALSFPGIVLLHLYWCMAQIVYPVGRTMPMVIAYDVQYFIMGTWYPLGIALFHAANLRFFHIAKLQKQFTHPSLQRHLDGCNGGKTSILCRLRNTPYTFRIMFFIGIGMVAQCVLTTGMWFACKKYHPTYGIPGTELKSKTFPEQVAELGRGWEWWPSLMWQVLWAWIIAPIMLFRAIPIRDTMGWRTQTIGCCIASLHAVPMFLAASYSPAFDKINAWFPPSQWIHLTTMVFEIFTIFVPVFQIIRLNIIARRAKNSNMRWETASQSSTLNSSTASASDWKLQTIETNEKGGKILDFSDPAAGDRLITMKALDYVLAENPAPLLEFSSLNDFSGENIAFLNMLARWKFSSANVPNASFDADVYSGALQIYVDFVSPVDAQFPLNLPSKKLKHLQSVFEAAARSIRGEGHYNAVTPFDFDGADEAAVGFTAVHYTGVIPGSFEIEIFDEIQEHIKYLVLTNTWPKFVMEMQSRRRSVDSGRTALTDDTHDSNDSQATLSSQISSQVRRLLKTINITRK